MQLIVHFLFLLSRPPPKPTLFPYTTLFRSRSASIAATWAFSACSSVSRAASLVLASVSKPARSEEHTSELQSLRHLVCGLLHEKKKGRPYGGQTRARGRRRIHELAPTRICS